MKFKMGGMEAFLRHLLSLDLSRYNPRVLPKSDALHAQLVETWRHSDPVAAWLLESLSEGAFTVRDGSIEWDKQISASDLQESYALSTARARHAPSFDVAARKLRKLLPQGALKKVRRSQGANRYFDYQLPDLKVAQQHFKTVNGVDPCAI
jgi:hypothetical protein